MRFGFKRLICLQLLSYVLVSLQPNEECNIVVWFIQGELTKQTTAALDEDLKWSDTLALLPRGSLSLSLLSLSSHIFRSPGNQNPPPIRHPYTVVSAGTPPLLHRSILKMSTGELLSIEPEELQFPFELKKQISCSLQLSNKTDEYVAFKVKTTNPKKYCVRPNSGVVLPHSTCDVIVTMQAQRESPPDLQCKDKFLLQSAVATPGATPKDITPETFSKESGNRVEESKLRVSYVPPPQPPSPVREGSEEGSSPRASVSDNGNSNGSEFAPVSRAYVDPQDNSSEAKALISKLTEEKNLTIQQNNKLRQELELLRHRGDKSRGGIPFIYVILIGLFGILLGYLMKT